MKRVDQPYVSSSVLKPSRKYIGNIFFWHFYYKKDLSLCNKIWFSNPYFFVNQCGRPFIFWTRISARSKNPNFEISKKHSGCKDIKVRKFKFAANTRSLQRSSEAFEFFLLSFPMCSPGVLPYRSFWTKLR